MVIPDDRAGFIIGSAGLKPFYMSVCEGIIGAIQMAAQGTFIIGNIFPFDGGWRS
jgi:hypothetical protein